MKEKEEEEDPVEFEAHPSLSLTFPGWKHKQSRANASVRSKAL